MKKIALFGTSADPPTVGHEMILRWLSECYDWVAVWAADNPFKKHQTPLEHRAAMLRLLIGEIDSLRQNIGFEQELSSYRTVETLEKAKQRWGTDQVEFTLVVGSDLIAQLPRWVRVKDLLHQVKLLIVPRPGYAIEKEYLERLSQLGANIAIADLTAPAISSTAYRENGQEEALTSTIKAYIHQEHLYKCQDATQKVLQIH